MTRYSARQVREILGLSASMVSRLVRAGFVHPARGPRREWRFSFQDLVVLRAAKGLAEARLPARRISGSLKRLRAQLPQQLPATGLRIAAVGNSVAVLEAGGSWRAADGQYLMAFDLVAPRGELFVLDPAKEISPAQWFEQGCRIEEREGAASAIAHYRAALAARASHAGIYINLGRLLHAGGQAGEAEAVYREGIAAYPEEAVLHYNSGVLLDEQARTEEAIACYRCALALDPKLPEAHYNLALLYEAAGRKREALRHFAVCRRLERGVT